MTDIIKIQEEINLQLGNKETFNALVTTTFKGLEGQVMKRAIMEGMMRGFKFEDFLEKNIYAIPFAGGYSLVTSIDYARKIGMRNGVIGKSAPHFEEKDGKIISCTITIKREYKGHVGEYSDTAYLDEYFKKGGSKPSLWETKPRTMLAKVAEMHALRMACPEELSQMYTEDEVQEITKVKSEINLTDHLNKLGSVKDLKELKAVWATLPVEAKEKLQTLKDELKAKLAPKENENIKV